VASFFWTTLYISENDDIIPNEMIRTKTKIARTIFSWSYWYFVHM